MFNVMLHYKMAALYVWSGGRLHQPSMYFILVGQKDIIINFFVGQKLSSPFSEESDSSESIWLWIMRLSMLAKFVSACAILGSRSSLRKKIPNIAWWKLTFPLTQLHSFKQHDTIIDNKRLDYLPVNSDEANLVFSKMRESISPAYQNCV